MCENSTKGPYKPRDLFGVQLEVTSLLLEAELMKLSTLQAELESTQNLIIENCKDTEQRQEFENQQLELILAISRIQAQADQLEREYRVHALGALKAAPLRGSGKSNRSQPAIGLKYLPKFRKMEPLQAIDDLEIQEKVESLAGKGTRVIDCEKSTKFQTEEVLLVNGFPVPLNGEEGIRIKEALLAGHVPPCDLLNEILMRAGILKNPVELETTMNVKTTTKTTEVLTLRDKNGLLLDERLKEVEEDNEYKSTSKEVWKKDNSKCMDRLAKCVEKVNFGSSTSVATNATSCVSSNGSSSGRSSTTGLLGVGSASGGSSPYNAPSTITSIPTNYFSAKSSMTNSPTPSTSMKHSHSPQSSFSSGISEASGSVSGSSTASSRLSPSIFGTVASSPTSDFSYSANHQRKTLPQTSISANGSIPSNCSIVSNGSHSEEPHAKVANATINGSIDTVQNSTSTAAPKSGTHEWDNALVYQETNLISGTIDALIQHLVPTQSYYPDRAYVFAFLLSSRLYIRPHELLGRVFRLAMATPSHSPKYQMAKEAKIISNVVQLLGEWAELFPYDFRDERMMAHVRTITQKCVSVEPPIRNEVSQLLTSLLARLTALERYEDFLHRINTEAALGEPATAPSILTICPNPTMLSQQLTHIELERLSNIGAEEFVQAFAKETSQVETRYKDMKKTRNLESYVQWFNRLSYYVATEICKMPKKKSRVRVVEYWIEAARECFNIGNFNSLMAIIAGLNMSPVTRLKKMWAKVNTAQLSILEHQMEPSSNFSSYRSTLKAAVWRSVGATDERQRIVIPFFSLLVKDLYFLNEGCASKLGNGHINFDKFWQLAKQVTEVVAWQQITCPFPKVQTVITSLQTAPIFGESALCLASYDCEPADNAQEKERLKYLRQDETTAKGCLSTGSSKEKELDTPKSKSKSHK